MRVGINEVLLYDRSSGARQRELVLVPALLRILEEEGHEATIYLGEHLSQSLLGGLLAGSSRTAIVRTPVPAVPTSMRIIRGALYFGRRTRQDRLDLFHTNYYPLPPSAAPILLTVHDVRFLHLPGTYTPARRKFLQVTVPLALRRAIRILADSLDTKRDLVEHYHVPECRVDVVPVPISPQFRREADTSRLSSVRAKYGLPEEYLLYVGHLEPRKNLVRLLRAYSVLRERLRDVPALIILGKESFGNAALREELESSNLRGSVRFTGYVDEADMTAAYSMANMLVFPSLHEGFGVPVLEAMACGVPVVTSNVSALPEVAGNAACLVDPYSIESIADGIARLLQDSALRASLIERGYARAANAIPERAAALTLAAYKRAIETTAT